MPKELHESISPVGLGHNHEALLYTFLQQFSYEEREELVALAQNDKQFWLKIIHIIKILGQTSPETMQHIINNSMKKALEELHETAPTS